MLGRSSLKIRVKLEDLPKQLLEMFVDIANKIKEMTGSTSEITFADALLFMTSLSIPDIHLANQRLEWFPIMTLDKGLESTIEYAKAHKVIINWSEVDNVKDF